MKETPLHLNHTLPAGVAVNADSLRVSSPTYSFTHVQIQLVNGPEDSTSSIILSPPSHLYSTCLSLVLCYLWPTPLKSVLMPPVLLSSNSLFTLLPQCSLFFVCLFLILLKKKTPHKQCMFTGFFKKIKYMPEKKKRKKITSNSINQI